MKMEQIECSETSTYIIQTPGNYPKENIIYSEHGGSLKSRGHLSSGLTLKPLTWKIWWAPNNASRWHVGFNSAFKGLMNLTPHLNLVPRLRMRGAILPLSLMSLECIGTTSNRFLEYSPRDADYFRLVRIVCEMRLLASPCLSVCVRLSVTVSDSPFVRMC